MGIFKKITKAVSKAVKNTVKSTGKAVEQTVSATGKLITGDVSGAVDKAFDAAKNYANTTTFGTVDVTGRNDGAFVNIDADKYADAFTGNGAKKVVTKNPDYSEYNNKNKAEKERKDAAADNKRTEAAKKKNALQYKVFVKSHADDLKNILGTKG